MDELGVGQSNNVLLYVAGGSTRAGSKRETIGWMLSSDGWTPGMNP